MNIFIINLDCALERREFQQMQLSRLGLDYEIITALSIEDTADIAYQKHASDWQRPLKNTEIACYYSHRLAWCKVIKDNQPALILEDDALLSKCVPELLNDLCNKKGVDLISLENRGRKKFVSKSGVDIKCNSKLFNLYQDRTGAAGYILWPKGAEKLIQHEKTEGIALADAHITACHSLQSYQVEPAAIIQLDQCIYYEINNTYSEKIAASTVSSRYNPKGGFSFRIKRICSQLKLGFYQLTLIIKSKKRYIKLKKEDF